MAANAPIRNLARLLLVGLVLLAGMQAAPATELTGAHLVEALRAGGHNIYFRHAETDWGQSDDLQKPDDWLQCDPARMRQLSDAGRASAVTVGSAIRKLAIPVNQVLASPYCRTMETATLMDLGPVEASTEVMNLRAARFFGGREAIVETARRLLATAPAEGGNRVIVAHGNVAREATPFYPSEGEALVFTPDRAGEFQLIGRITVSAWAELLMRYTP